MLDLSYFWPVAGATFVGSIYARRKTALLLAIEPAGFVAISALLIPIVGFPWHPIFQTLQGASPTPQRIAVAIWWLLAARLVLLAGRILHERQTDAPRLVFDLASGVVHVGVIIIILSLAFGVSVPGLIATSGIIAIVIGLALQNTLGDLFSGIAIELEKPFSIGDYIWIEGAMEGVVLETNWRATRIVTDTNDIATVPNSVVAKARILNRSLPTEVRSDVIRLVLESSVLPQNGIEFLMAATYSVAAGTAHSWSVHCGDLKGEGTSYEVRFAAPRRSLSAVKSGYLAQVARHARYRGISLAMQNGSPQRTAAMPTAIQLFKETGLFSGLSDAEWKSLEQKLIVRRGGKGETLISPDEMDASFFVIAQGVLASFPRTDDGAQQMRTLGPGDYVGERSATADSRPTAPIRSLTTFMSYELRSTDLETLFRDHTDVRNAFSSAYESAEKAMDMADSAKGQPENIPSTLVDKVKAYLPF